MDLKIFHWNCFCLTRAKVIELRDYVNKFSPDIVSLNELKMSEETANLMMRFDGYASYFKVRNKHGGGVAIIIKILIPHVQILNLNPDMEIVGVTVNLKKSKFDVYSLYNPPSVLIPYDFFINLFESKIDFVLVGDLNSKAISLGCKQYDRNGKVIEKILSDTDFVVHNNSCPTFRRERTKTGSDAEVYEEILDLCLSSGSLSNQLFEFKVLLSNDMTSDHYPFEIKLKSNHFYLNNNKPHTDRFNLEKADWDTYRSSLERIARSYSDHDLCNMEINQLNQLVINDIMESANYSIPKFKLPTKRPLPYEIILLIKQRRTARATKNKNNNQENKSKYNYLTKRVKQAIIAFENNKWQTFLDTLGEYPVSTRGFWQQINKIRVAKQSAVLPTLVRNNIEFINDTDKANLFANDLKVTFSNDDSHNFDNDHFLNVNNYLENLNLENIPFVPFSSNELVKRISKLKVNSASGSDSVQNLFIKQAPFEYVRKVVLVLLNKAIEHGIPSDWKKADITMIPKKNLKSKDPNDYRPISLTSCLGKLAERLVKSRLYKELEEKKLIAIQQSGFRENRATADNLLFFTQKISESLNISKSACGVFFDISKAFDKVWHDGLVFKLSKLGIPTYILKYIIDFLSNRSFRVKVSNSYSNFYPIKCSVPQGSVLGPLLFLVYINDIPLTNIMNNKFCKSSSSLFADDLAALFQYNHSKRSTLVRVEGIINSYILSVTEWLSKWRLNMNANKCCYTVFSKGNKNYDYNFTLPINGFSIPFNKNPIFLGITFDRELRFHVHIDNLVTRANKRLNVIKILSHSSWKLNKQTLTAIYNALIGSIFNYTFFCRAKIAATNLNRLQVIQNNAIRRIYKIRMDSHTSTAQLIKISKIQPLSLRFDQLGCRYIFKALACNSLIILLINEYLKSVSKIRKKRDKSSNTPLCLLLKLYGLAYAFHVFITLCGIGLVVTTFRPYDGLGLD